MEGGLLIEFGDSRPPVELRFLLSDSDIHLLRGFLSEVELLFQSIERIGGFNSTLQLRSSDATDVQVVPTEPDQDHRAIVLHRLRPLILQDEPYAFHRVCATISRSSSSPFLRQHIKNLRSKFYCDSFQEIFRISHGSLVLNSEKGFQAWLNGFEYHREKAKADAISSDSDVLDVSQLRPIFIMMIGEKKQAIQSLGTLASTMLSQPKL